MPAAYNRSAQSPDAQTLTSPPTTHQKRGHAKNEVSPSDSATSWFCAAATTQRRAQPGEDPKGAIPDPAVKAQWALHTGLIVKRFQTPTELQARQEEKAAHKPDGDLRKAVDVSKRNKGGVAESMRCSLEAQATRAEEGGEFDDTSESSNQKYVRFFKEFADAGPKREKCQCDGQIVRECIFHRQRFA